MSRKQLALKSLMLAAVMDFVWADAREPSRRQWQCQRRIRGLLRWRRVLRQPVVLRWGISASGGGHSAQLPEPAPRWWRRRIGAAATHTPAGGGAQDGWRGPKALTRLE